MTATAPSSRSAGVPPGGGIGADARRVRDAITAGLAEPAADIVRTLQQLALAQLDDGDDPLDPRLVDRARSLAHALQLAIDELIAEGTSRGTLDGREPQATVRVGDVFTNAGRRSGRRVVVRGEDACVVTNPDRFADLALALLDAAAAVVDGDIVVTADRQRTELLVEIEGVRLASDALDRIRRLARSLGGSVQPARPNGAVAVSVWLPQQRLGDAPD